MHLHCLGINCSDGSKVVKSGSDGLPLHHLQWGGRAACPDGVRLVLGSHVWGTAGPPTPVQEVRKHDIYCVPLVEQGWDRG